MLCHHPSRQASPGRRQVGQSFKVPLSMLRTCACLGLLAVVAVALAGCGSTSPSPSASAPPASQTPSTTQETPTSETATSTSTTNSSVSSAAAPNTSGPPSFVTDLDMQGGDKVKLEGWFGPPLPAAESNVDQTALSECPQPTDDGRAIVVALDLTATLESSLSGEVELNLGTLPPETLAEYILGFSSGAQCEAAVENPTGIKLGTLQPHRSTTFALWIAFGNAITPNDPHPSEAVLRANNWLMSLPHATVDSESSAYGHANATGPRAVKCVQAGYTAGEETLAVIGGTPKLVQAQTCP